MVERERDGESKRDRDSADVCCIPSVTTPGLPRIGPMGERKINRRDGPPRSRRGRISCRASRRFPRGPRLWMAAPGRESNRGSGVVQGAERDDHQGSGN